MALICWSATRAAASASRVSPHHDGVTVSVVAEADHRVAPSSSEKAKRREARAAVDAYHQKQLRALLEHVREGFAQLDAGDINEFQLDDLIHRYKRAAKHLWLFCESSGGQSLHAATALTTMRDRGEERDWWAESARARDER